jgi:hypothetical protein
MADEISTVANFLKDYGTLIAIPAATLVGSLAYMFQKFIDRKSALIELRRSTYTAYLEALFKLIVKITPEDNLFYNLKLMELAAVASDDVVRKVGNIRNIFGEAEIGHVKADKEAAKEIIGDLIIEMRKDCFESSHLTIDEVIKITPIR